MNGKLDNVFSLRQERGEWMRRAIEAEGKETAARKAAENLTTALQTVEGDYQWLGKNTPYVHCIGRIGAKESWRYTPEGLDSFRYYPSLDALVKAERERA